MTELDYCVLAVVWREGPMSGYRVRRHFAESGPTTWSSSTGSIYPAIRRLLAAGLLHAEEPADDRRTQQLKATRAAVAHLKKWIIEIAPSHGVATADPIRTRAQFISILDEPGRRRFVAESIEVTSFALHEMMEVAAKLKADPKQQLEYIGTVGAIHELRARLSWLKKLSRMPLVSRKR